LTAGVAAAPQMDQQFAAVQRANAEALRQYTWKSRTEIQRAGETKSIQLALMRYDMFGAVQKTPLSSTPQPQLPARGLRGRVAQKRKEDFLDTLESLERQAKAYSDLSPDNMRRFVATAIVTPEMGIQQRLLRANGADVVQPGDSLTLWVNAETHKLRKLEVQTTVDRSPMRVVSAFQDLPSGPTYLARSVIDYPSERLTVIAENFDYQRTGR
jgi:hypothetical protein